MADGSGVFHGVFSGPHRGSIEDAGDASLHSSLEKIGLDGVDPYSISPLLVGPLQRLAPLWGSALSDDTLRSRRTDLRRFATWCSQAGVEAFRSDEALADLMEQHLEAVGQDYSIGTVRRVGTSLTALAEGLGSDRAARGARERRRLAVRSAAKAGAARGLRHEKHRLTLDQLTAFRQAILNAETGAVRKARDLAILSVMCDVLARRSEVSGFTLADLDLGHGTILISRSKTDQEGKGVRYALSDGTLRELERWLDVSGLDRIACDDRSRLPLFCGMRTGGKLLIGRSGVPEPLAGRSVARIMGEYGDRIGIKGVSGHTIRRTMARLLREGGTPEDEIVSLGRWSSLEQMRDYAGLCAPRKGAAASVLHF
jgi:integrase